MDDRADGAAMDRTLRARPLASKSEFPFILPWERIFQRLFGSPGDTDGDRRPVCGYPPQHRVDQREDDERTMQPGDCILADESAVAARWVPRRRGGESSSH